MPGVKFRGGGWIIDYLSLSASYVMRISGEGKGSISFLLPVLIATVVAMPILRELVEKA